MQSIFQQRFFPPETEISVLFTRNWWHWLWRVWKNPEFQADRGNSPGPRVTSTLVGLCPYPSAFTVPISSLRASNHNYPQFEEFLWPAESLLELLWAIQEEPELIPPPSEAHPVTEHRWVNANSFTHKYGDSEKIQFTVFYFTVVGLSS